MSLFTIDELCILLDIEADKESNILDTSGNDICGETFDCYDCTRPEGHTGYHIALRLGTPSIVAMWLG